MQEGLVEHVLHEPTFKDERLLYRVVNTSRAVAFSLSSSQNTLDGKSQTVFLMRRGNILLVALAEPDYSYC